MLAQHSLSIAVLTIYATLSIPTVFVTIKHGVRGLALLGWGYLLAFCTLKIVGSALQLSDPKSSGASVVTSIGLSPLILAASGILHEARFHRHVNPQPNKNDTVVILFFHVLVTSTIALIASGASKLASHSTDPSSTPVDEDKDYHHAAAGAGLLFLAWLALVGATYWSVLFGKPSTAVHEDEAVSDGMKLLLGIAFALPFLGIRVLTSLVYFATRNSALSPVGGSIGLQVGLEVVEEMIVAIALVSVGVLTRNAKMASKRDPASRTEATTLIPSPIYRK